MARMIPAVVSADTQSRGEVDIFARLQNDPATADWIVLHSLDLARHPVKVSGELDFVVLVPGLGVLCLEVKACRQLRRNADGFWFYGYDPEPDERGPFKQASQGMHALRAFIRERRPDLISHVVYWSAVVFPFVDFTLSSSEWHDWQYIDARAYRSHSLSNLLERVLLQARLHLTNSPGATWFSPNITAPTVTQCEEIAEVLRPRFEVFENTRARRDNLERELKQYTGEQLGALRSMERNPRVAFQGPAGTGKTVLATEAVRRAALAGRTVLLLCFNAFLGAELKGDLATLSDRVTVRTLHAHMLQVAGARAQEYPQTPDFWQRVLPDLALDALLDDDTGKFLFDELIVDEGQDILKPAYLDVLDQTLRGGLAAGRWRLFGDWDHQGLYADDPISGEVTGGQRTDLSLERYCETRGSNAPIFDLRVNCRNTPRIAAWAENLGAMKPGYDRVLRPDDRIEPEIHSYAPEAEQITLLQAALEKLNRENYRGRDIVILSARSGEACAASRLPEPWHGRLRPFNPTGSDGAIRYTTIHAFKGLEAPVVIVTDIDASTPRRTQLLFVAATRALNRLIVLPHRDVHQEIVERMFEASRP